jgi:hypothetical protein
MMATAATPHVSSFDHLAHERQLAVCLRHLQAAGWEQRLQPFTTHMAQHHLVRARGHGGAPLRHLHLEVLREALRRLLHRQWEDGYLIYQLVVEGAEPALVAAERGVSRPVLVEQLREAVGRLAMEYEDITYEGVETGAKRMRAALARKRG